jgi:hypothetical protein
MDKENFDENPKNKGNVAMLNDVYKMIKFLEDYENNLKSLKNEVDKMLLEDVLGKK